MIKNGFRHQFRWAQRARPSRVATREDNCFISFFYLLSETMPRRPQAYGKSQARGSHHLSQPTQLPRHESDDEEEEEEEEEEERRRLPEPAPETSEEEEEEEGNSV